MKTMKLWRISFMMLAAFSLASCSSDDEDYDVNNLAGTWEQVYDKGIQDAGIVRYTFFPESSTAGRIELYVNSWPDFRQETTDLNYVMGYTGHMNIFSGKVHDETSKSVGEYDIHKLTSNEMIWYRTDSNEELARFKKIK
jgi:hypothetical protein